jgi:hypothetical protein
MNVATITMDEEEARAKLDEYRSGLALRDDDEYERLVKAYTALAKGSPLLVLSQVIAKAPRDERLRPRLAIARADRFQVHYLRERNGRQETFSTRRTWRERSLDTLVRAPEVAGFTPAYPQSQYGPTEQWRDSTIEGYALVPIVPPAVRGRRALHTHFVLFEVERWADQPIRAQADRDPYLLAKIGEDLYAVVGEWDLTDIERAIMSDRRLA